MTQQTAPNGAAAAPNGESKKSSKKLRLISTLFMLLLIAVTLYIIFRDTSLTKFWSSVQSSDPLWLLAALGAAVFASLMFGVALHLALRVLYGKPISLMRNIGFGYIGQYYTAVTPAGVAGQPMQLYYMLAYGVEVSFASLALLLVNAAHQLVVLLIPTVLFPFRAGLILENLGAFLWLFILGSLINIGLILFLLFAMFSKNFAGRIVHKVISILTKLHIVKHPERIEKRVSEQIALYQKGAEVFKTHKWLLFGELFSYILLLGSQFVIPYFIYRAFHLTAFGMIDFIALQSVLYLAVCFLPIPGSAGASESGFVQLFRVLFQSALIVPAMLLSRVASFYFILILSGAVSLAMQLVLTYRKKHQPKLAEPEIIE
ncbi:MAG: lysylphosphatidylglycerol synthase transmembrane domain-containing protein [Christensenella sp.]|nr:lysylphosphatidylglycerol synthase transmembrane domain-containing protein [Christensenella sp.]